jgi:hypothetical protein
VVFLKIMCVTHFLLQSSRYLPVHWKIQKHHLLLNYLDLISFYIILDDFREDEGIELRITPRLCLQAVKSQIFLVRSKMQSIDRHNYPPTQLSNFLPLLEE